MQLYVIYQNQKKIQNLFLSNLFFVKTFHIGITMQSNRLVCTSFVIRIWYDAIFIIISQKNIVTEKNVCEKLNM